jgi:concanavalin A-like lectin/glucanase superfamily protein
VFRKIFSQSIKKQKKNKTMKKQFLFTAVIISGILFSCTKEGVETQSTNNPDNAERSGKPIVLDPLSVNLEGWFAFDGNLHDKTSQLADAVPTSRAYIFGTDRKGNLKSAMYFDSTYGLNIYNVPQQTNTSVSAWVKYVNPMQLSLRIFGPDGTGPIVGQNQDKLIGAVEIDTYGSFGDGMGVVADSKWHHIAVTYDGTSIKIYLDGVLKSTYTKVGTISPTTVKYIVGRDLFGRNWKGYVDELRFYSRTLTASDVTALYNK